MLGDIVSFCSGLILLFFGTLAMIAYQPRLRYMWSDKGGEVLGLAIYIGFLSAVANTFYWQVLGHLSIWLNWITIIELRALGDWADLLFKGGGGVSGWLHLRALKFWLSEEDQKNWSLWEMPWHPKRRRCLAWLFNRKYDATDD